MKKLLALLLTLVLVLPFAACKEKEQAKEDSMSKSMSESMSESQSDSMSKSQTDSKSQSEMEEAFMAVHVKHADWADDVKAAINDFVDSYGMASDSYEDPYVVFDFDNTCSIFDVEEQLAIHQLNTMTFAFTPQELPAILEEGLGDIG